MIRIMSDLHLEISKGVIDIPNIETESATTLILAGDIGLCKNPSTFLPFVEDMANRFFAVIYVLGNHEFYRSSLLRSADKIKEAVSHLLNVFILDNETVTINDVVFIGSTLWTDFDKRSPVAMWDIEQGLNDYKFIRTGPHVGASYQRKMKPIDILAIHDISRDFIFSEIKKYKAWGKKVVVISHHGPSWQSVDSQFKNDIMAARLNGAYVSDLDTLIVDSKPNLWIHGHTHISFDYMIEETRVICNPRGYFGYLDQNDNFDPLLTIDL